MTERRPEEMTLRELFIDAERLTRELIDHLEQGFIPKIHSLRELVQPMADGPSEDDLRSGEHVPDMTVRIHASRLQENERFTDQLFSQLQRYFDAIDQSIEKNYSQ